MEQLSTVVKSKSSNNAIPLKPKKNKKSISDGDFTPNLMKKRGVYVDRKVFQSPLDTREANDYRTNRKPPPRPKPGQKKFLASVLTILSKSTNTHTHGTQYPDIKEHTDTKKTKNLSRLRNETGTRTEKPNKHAKYKSRILNKNIYNDDDDQFVILQSTKQIIQTPSTYSEANTFSAPEEKTKIRSIRDILLNNNYNDVAEDLTRDLLEEKTVKKEKKIRIKDEPETIASQITKEGEKKIYNLFVDLLESTFNSYNLKDGALSESNVALEINESIAKKLTINNKSQLNDATIKKTPLTTTEQQKHIDSPINVRLSNHRAIRVNPTISAKSCEYTKKNYIPEIQSFPRKKKTIRNNRKRNLLNIFKEELQNKPTHEEPINLFQALKVMARNKQKRHIYEKTKKLKEASADNLDRHECVFKRRKIISMKTKKANKTTVGRGVIGQKYSEYNSRFKKREISPKIPSQHSLKVYGYNYEELVERKSSQRPKSHEKLTQNQVKPRPLARTPSPFVMESNLDYYTLLQFPDRSSYNFTY